MKLKKSTKKKDVEVINNEEEAIEIETTMIDRPMVKEDNTKRNNTIKMITERIIKIAEEEIITIKHEANTKKKHAIKMAKNNCTKRKSISMMVKNQNTKRKKIMFKKKIKRKDNIPKVINHPLNWKKQNQIDSQEWKTSSIDHRINKFI